jgi:hypothetical protein
MLDIVSLIPGLKPVKIGASTTTYLWSFISFSINHSNNSPDGLVYDV